MRDRLIELLEEASQIWDESPLGSFNEVCADHLLANGVIVPPVRVGQTVLYNPFGNHLLELEIAQIIIEPIAEIGMSFHCCGGVVFDMRDFGKTAFLTREDAEKALRKENGK